MATGLSEATLRRIFDKQGRLLQANMRQHGAIYTMLFGIDARGQQVAAVMPDDVADLVAGPTTVGISEPFRDHQGDIAEVFTKRGAQAAMFYGEAWTFPEEDPDAALEHLRSGLMPSEHPNRQEIVFLSLHWPLGGVSWLETWRIVRTPGESYLRPRTRQLEAIQDPLSFISGWIEETLPQPQPGE